MRVALLVALGSLTLGVTALAKKAPPLKDPAPVSTKAPMRAVFFYSGGLVPLACYDTKIKLFFRKDLLCFDKIKSNTSIVLPNGTAVKIKGVGVGLLSGVSEVKALKVSSEPTVGWFAPISYPNDKTLSMIRYEEPTALEVTISSDEKSALEKLLPRKKGQRVSVFQKVTVDLDGDWSPETLYSVNIPAEEMGSYHWSGVVMAAGGDLGALSIVYEYAPESGAISQRAWFNGSFDLDGDKQRELSVVHAYLADYQQALLRLEKGTLVSIALEHTAITSK